MKSLILSLVPATFVLLAGMMAFGIAFWKKKQRRTEPPDPFILLRQPGESLRRTLATLDEQIMSWIMRGMISLLAVLCVPLLAGVISAKANQAILALTSLALCVGVFSWMVRRLLCVIQDYQSTRLGYLGERLVGEQLETLTRSGWYIFHDVPLQINGYPQNIDHVAVAPEGLVVIETKTRSKPLKETGRKAEVRFDGQRLIWPFQGDDSWTVKQVALYAGWIERWVEERCGLKVPAQQMIAIPGWTVDPGKCYQPRVVSGGAVSQSLMSMTEGKRRVLDNRQIRQIVTELEKLCRDVKD